MQRTETEFGSRTKVQVRGGIRARTVRMPVVDEQLVVAASQLVEVGGRLHLPWAARALELDDAVVLGDRQAQVMLALERDGVSVAERQRVGPVGGVVAAGDVEDGRRKTVERLLQRPEEGAYRFGRGPTRQRAAAWRPERRADRDPGRALRAPTRARSPRRSSRGTGAPSGPAACAPRGRRAPAQTLG